MNSEISRRDILKLIAGSGLAVYVRPWELKPAWSMSSSSVGSISPIDRSLPDIAPAQFYADDPERAHKVLWNKAGFMTEIGGKLPSPTEHVPLVIVGGGISGLFSAYLLRKYQPVVLELASRFGGNSKGQSWRNIDYSIGAAYFIQPEEESDIAKLCTELGIDQLWKLKEEEDPLVLDKKIYRNFWTGETMENDPKGKAQLKKLADYFRQVNEGETIAYPDIPITDPEQSDYINGLDKVSFKKHLENIVGGPLTKQIETAIEHYCWSSFGASSTEIGAASGVNFYAAEFGTLAILPGGNSAAAEKVLEKLHSELPADRLRPDSLVFDVREVNDGTLVSYQGREGKITTIHAKAVVMACPKFVVGKILDGIEPKRMEAIRKIKYRSYLVANVCLKGSADPFYDLYMLGNGKISPGDVKASAVAQRVTDVILANYAKADTNSTVLTLYRGMPYDAARAELYDPGSYKLYRESFEQQIKNEILPLLKLKKEDIVDLRLARWGHPLPVAATGLISDGTLETIRKPFGTRVFFVEQDNWALPAFETAVTEALTWAPEVEKVLAA